MQEGFALCAELRQEVGVRGAPDDTLLNVGARYRLTANLALQGSVGRSLDPKANAGSELVAYLGIQLSF